jgi:mannonate dehydratase
LFGDISAITQINRVGPALQAAVKREDWHARLLNGSDYPLPGVLPLFSLKQMLRRGYVTEPQAEVLSAIRRHNPLLFDFVLKRAIRIDDRAFGPEPFQTRAFFEAAMRTG